MQNFGAERIKDEAILVARILLVVLFEGYPPDLIDPRSMFWISWSTASKRMAIDKLRLRCVGGEVPQQQTAIRHRPADHV